MAVSELIDPQHLDQAMLARKAREALLALVESIFAELKDVDRMKFTLRVELHKEMPE